MVDAMADTISLPLAWWIDLEFMPWWKAGLIFGACAIPIVLLGMRSLAGLGPARKWVAIGARLLVLLVVVLILRGARWQRLHKTVEVVVMRDISDGVVKDDLRENLRARYRRDSLHGASFDGEDMDGI